MTHEVSEYGSISPEIVWAVEGVEAPDIAHVWQEVWPWLSASIARFPNVRNPYTEGGLLTDLMSKKSQLWIAWNIPEDRVLGTVITEILIDLDRRNSKVLHMAIVGGDRLEEWRHSLWQVIKEWAVHNGCEVAAYRGRKGWSRIAGFSFIQNDADGVPLYYRRIKKG